MANLLPVRNHRLCLKLEFPMNFAELFEADHGGQYASIGFWKGHRYGNVRGVQPPWILDPRITAFTGGNNLEHRTAQTFQKRNPFIHTTDGKALHGQNHVRRFGFSTLEKCFLGFRFTQ